MNLYELKDNLEDLKDNLQDDFNIDIEVVLYSEFVGLLVNKENENISDEFVLALIDSVNEFLERFPEPSIRHDGLKYGCSNYLLKIGRRSKSIIFRSIEKLKSDIGQIGTIYIFFNLDEVDSIKTYNEFYSNKIIYNK